MIFPRENVILSQWVPFPVIGKQDAPKIGMSGEQDPQQVLCFPLVPVRRRPQISHAVY
jgi:hypothetical protein